MKVSVIIPCYNVRDHVGCAIRSALSQTYADIELIVVDDGSSDGTVAVVQEFVRADPRRVHFIAAQHRGACAARNAGLASATGTYLQFLDADDELLPDKIARQVAIAQHAEMPELVVGAYREKWPDGSEKVLLPDPTSPWMGLIRTRLGTTSSGLWLRAAVLAAGGWDEALKSSQDYELAFRMLRSGSRVAIDPRVGALILKRASGSISKSDTTGNWSRYITLRQQVRDHLKDQDPRKYAAEIHEAEQYLFRAIRMLGRTDPVAALKAHGDILPKGFVPHAGEALSKAYVRWYRLFGFRSAERAAAAMDNLRRSNGHR